MQNSEKNSIVGKRRLSSIFFLQEQFGNVCKTENFNISILKKGVHAKNRFFPCNLQKYLNKKCFSWLSFYLLIYLLQNWQLGRWKKLQKKELVQKCFFNIFLYDFAKKKNFPTIFFIYYKIMTAWQTEKKSKKGLVQKNAFRFPQKVVWGKEMHQEKCFPD